MTTKKIRKIHTQELKQEAVNLAAKQCVAKNDKRARFLRVTNLRLAYQIYQESQRAVFACYHEANHD